MKKEIDFENPKWIDDDQKQRFDLAVKEWHETNDEITINQNLLTIIACSFISAEEKGKQEMPDSVIQKVLTHAVQTVIDHSSEMFEIMDMMDRIKKVIHVVKID